MGVTQSQNTQKDNKMYLWAVAIVLLIDQQKRSMIQIAENLQYIFTCAEIKQCHTFQIAKGILKLVRISTDCKSRLHQKCIQIDLFVTFSVVVNFYSFNA